MTQVPRNPIPIPSWDGVKTCNLDPEHRRNPQRLPMGLLPSTLQALALTLTCGREAPNQWPG